MEVLTREHPWYTLLPLTAILAYLLTLTGLWQLVFAAGILAGVLHRRPARAFALALAAGILAWGIPLGIAALFFPLARASALLLGILGLPSSLTFLPFLLAVLVSGLTTGLGALLGAYAYGLASAGRRELEQAQ